MDRIFPEILYPIAFLSLLASVIVSFSVSGSDFSFFSSAPSCSRDVRTRIGAIEAPAAQTFARTASDSRLCLHMPNVTFDEVVNRDSQSDCGTT